MSLSCLRLTVLCSLAAALAVMGGCSTISIDSHKTRVESTWKDPRYAGAPMRKVFVLSLMKIEPGGRDAVEDALVAQLNAAGVAGVASHTVLSSDPQKPGPTLLEAITASGADGVLLVQVKAMGSYEPGTMGTAVTAVSPDTMADYNALKRDGWNQAGDYKVAQIVSELYASAMSRQVWTAFTNSYDASNLARNIPDYTVKLVSALAKDRMIAVAVKPAS
jgi:hypothetical protein